MKKTRQMIVGIFLFTLFIGKVKAQSSDTTLDVVNWNIEWFGSAVNGPFNKDLQEENVKKILRYLGADIYALTEVVDTARLKRVTDSLGNDYAFVVSDYCSLAASPFDADWKTGQKLAFIYRKSIVSNVRTRGFMRNSPSANYNFASGRLPYLLSANVSVNRVKRNMNFFLIHGKSGSTAADYNRRKAAADEMKDSLDAAYAAGANIILGDFNDDLDRTISSGSGTLSSYNKLIKDSADSDHYVSITLPLSYMGQNSTISYADAIDHQVISNEADSMYIKGSAAIRKDISVVVPDYTTRNTSDHYPVFSSYKMISGDTSTAVIAPPPITAIPASVAGFKIGPNPFINQLFIQSATALTNAELILFNLLGQRLWADKQANIPSQSVSNITLPYLPAGTYFLQITSKQFNQTFHLYKY